MASRPTPRLEDMTEPELRELTRKLLNLCTERLPEGVMLAILFCPFGDHGVGQYGSNCRRSDMIKMLRETADRLELRQDVPR